MGEPVALATMFVDARNLRVEVYPDGTVRLWQLTGGEIWLMLDELVRCFSFAAVELAARAKREAGGDG